MNRAATTIFSDEFSNVERASKTPASLSRKIHACGGDNFSISFHVLHSTPLPSYQRGRSRARTYRESVKNRDELAVVNTSLSSALKKRNRTRTVQPSRLSSLCDTEGAHLLKSLLVDLTQPWNSSIGEPFSQRCRESIALSDSSESSSLLTAELTKHLGETQNKFA